MLIASFTEYISQTINTKYLGFLRCLMFYNFYYEKAEISFT